MAKSKRVKWHTECQFGLAFERACRQAVILAAIENALKESEMYSHKTHTSTNATLAVCDAIIARAHLREEIAEWIRDANNEARKEVAHRSVKVGAK